LDTLPDLDLSEDKMSRILRDVHLIEARLSELSNGPAKDSAAQALYQSLLQRHELDSSRFNRNMNALLLSPDLTQRLSSKAMVLIEKNDWE
jgi:hypothetical protein